MLSSHVGGVGRARAARGLPQFLGVFAVGFHASSSGLHPAFSHSYPPLSIHTLPPCVQTQNPAKGSLFQ